MGDSDCSETEPMIKRSKHYPRVRAEMGTQRRKNGENGAQLVGVISAPDSASTHSVIAYTGARFVATVNAIEENGYQEKKIRRHESYFQGRAYLLTSHVKLTANHDAEIPPPNRTARPPTWVISNVTLSLLVDPNITARFHGQGVQETTQLAHSASFSRPLATNPAHNAAAENAPLVFAVRGRHFQIEVLGANAKPR